MRPKHPGAHFALAPYKTPGDLPGFGGAWADDHAEKSGSVLRASASFAATLAGLVVLVLAVRAGVFGQGKTGVLLLPVLGAAGAIALLPARNRAVLAERDTWVMMLIYSIAFGGFVGMSS
ncbi:MAG: transporter, family, nitrate/nitrite transporter [Paraburkholderia sp.]|nr:transporter, family, nitrate/nitrite transporter [Paraburkholderia sp.]